MNLFNKNKKEEFIECPWCGEPPIYNYTGHTKHSGIIECINPKCPLQPKTSVITSPEIASEIWNKPFIINVEKEKPVPPPLRKLVEGSVKKLI